MQDIGSPPEGWRSLLSGIAKHRPSQSGGGWEFKEATDFSFESQFPTTADDALVRWRARGSQLHAKAVSVAAEFGGKSKIPATQDNVDVKGPMPRSVKLEKGKPGGKTRL